MQGNFEKQLELSLDGFYVIAKGPLDAEVANVKLVCAWVVQRGTGASADAVCNNMAVPGETGVMDPPPTPDTTLKIFDLGKATARWEFPLADRDGLVDIAFQLGPATAYAVAVFEDGDKNQCSLAWVEPVEIVANGSLSTTTPTK